jgi:hypothetical protein
MIDQHEPSRLRVEPDVDSRVNFPILHMPHRSMGSAPATLLNEVRAQ